MSRPPGLRCSAGLSAIGTNVGVAQAVTIASMAGMPQQPAAVFLALLIALPAVGPVAASEAALAPSPLSATRALTAPDPAVTAAIGVSSDPADHGRPDATGRYIVMLKDGADTAAVVDKARRHDAVHADQKFR